MIRFHKIDYNQFKEYILDDEHLYNNFTLPTKKDKYDSIYSFIAPYDITIKPYEIHYIPTCVYSILKETEIFMIFPLKELNFGPNIREAYPQELNRLIKGYTNKQDYHIFIRIENVQDTTYEIKKGVSYCTGTFGKIKTKINQNNININHFDKIN